MYEGRVFLQRMDMSVSGQVGDACLDLGGGKEATYTGDVRSENIGEDGVPYTSM